jgi:hypothetical protein
MMQELRKHVLLWVSSDFIESEGILQIMKEAGLLPTSQKDEEHLLESAEQISGFAVTGWLVDVHHGAGIWIAPKDSPDLEMMIPWSMIRTVITAEEKGERIVGLASAALRRDRLRRAELKSKADSVKN